jgi:hypothetical protein
MNWIDVAATFGLQASLITRYMRQTKHPVKRIENFTALLLLEKFGGLCVCLVCVLRLRRRRLITKINIQSRILRKHSRYHPLLWLCSKKREDQQILSKYYIGKAGILLVSGFASASAASASASISLPIRFDGSFINGSGQAMLSKK